MQPPTAEERPMPSQELTAAPTAPRDAAAELRREASVVLEHIVEHHAYERRALPYVVALLAKVAAAHRRRNPKLPALCDAGQELAEVLEGHDDDEERALFPALQAGAPADGEAAHELDRMRRHHGALSLLLERVRWLADDFSVPAWGGRSYQLLMEELEALEDDVLEHVHLEAFGLLLRPGAAGGGGR
jgi:regulator of cell morphogenesis and NO signaling